MDIHELEKKLSAELAAREDRVLNKNALAALFGAFGGPGAAIQSLGKIFFGRGDAIDAEKQRLERECILELLCSIDDAVNQVQSRANSQGFIIDGLIETVATRSDSVVGVEINDTENVTMASGTRIRTEAIDAKNVTGFRIGPG